ncbi:MAG: hypothetical protein SFV15_18790 [Polyangiaceae bacterium]|nr:hypothetical protein [Polyangiaceae bacterium]
MKRWQSALVFTALLRSAAADAAPEDNADRSSSLAHAVSVASVLPSRSLPKELLLLWEARQNFGAVEGFAVGDGGIFLASGARGGSVALNRKGQPIWSNGGASGWLLSPLAARFGFVAVVSPLSLVGWSERGTLLYELALRADETVENLMLAALSNGSVALVSGRHLFVVDATGRQTLELLLPEKAVALVEVGAELTVALASGRVVSVSTWGTIHYRGAIGRQPEAAMAYREDLLIATSEGVHLLNLTSRRSRLVLAYEPEERLLALETNALGFQLISRSGQLRRVDLGGRLAFSLKLEPGQATAGGPNFFMTTDDIGQTAVATPEGRLLIVSPEGAVRAQQTLFCARVTLLSQRSGQVLVGCSDGKIVAYGAG